jgi:protein phosphatase
LDNVAVRTHRGRRRRNNEDSVLAVELDGELLLAVADGLGGERGGEVASAEAIRVLEAEMRASIGAPLKLRLTLAVEAACLAIWKHAQSETRLRGMATTLVAALIADDVAWVANVGDSRASLITSDGLKQISNDHSLVGEYVREGEISEEEARASNLKHIVTRTVGSEESVEVDVFGPLRLAAGDTLLLSSDGLHDVVAPDDIGALAGDADLGRAARSLVDAANALGGPDNISVVLYRAPS